MEEIKNKTIWTANKINELIALQQESEAKLFDNGKNKARDILVNDGAHLIIDPTPEEKAAAEEAR